MKTPRSLWLSVVVLLVFGATPLLSGCVQQSDQAGQPRIAADLLVAFGGIPGEPPTDRQRISYEASFTNIGTAPVRGWRWEVVIAPEIQTRLIRAEQRIDPDPGPSAASRDWHPGETVKITGYLDLNTEGMSKEYLAAIAEPVVIRIMDADGREVFRSSRKLTK